MPLYIADAETTRLADELSNLTGTTKTKAVHDALQAELRRIKRQMEAPQRYERIMSVAKEFSSQLTGPAPSQEEMDDFLYDEKGLPH
jgi:antitoxin VapB